MRHTHAEDNVTGYLRPDQRLHDRPLDPCCNVGEATHAVERQAQTQHPIHAEQGGMAVIGGRVQPLHIIERDERIGQKPEQPRTAQIPEQNGEEEHEWPMIGRPPLGFMLNLIPRWASSSSTSRELVVKRK